MENESEMPGWHGIPHRPDLELLLNLDDHDLGNCNLLHFPPRFPPAYYLYTFCVMCDMMTRAALPPALAR